jgi:alkyl hydroperoxide reductase subunit D
MKNLEALAERLPEHCKDLRLNLTTLMSTGTALAENVKWSIALASATFIGHPTEFVDATLADAREVLSDTELADAQAAASLMGMTTVYYRTRHLLGKPSYTEKRAGLRMNYMGKPANKLLFEQSSMACSALAGCEYCLKAHEGTLLQQGLGEDEIHDIFRLAAALNGFAIALEVARGLAASPA